MSETASKIKASSWQPTTTHQSDSHLTPRPFPMPVNNAPQVQASQDLSGYRKPQSGDMIENVSRSESSVIQHNDPIKSKENFLVAPAPSTFGLNIQPKLTIGEPGDRYEQEADKVASEVVQRINTPPSVQRRELRAAPISTLSSQSGGWGEIKLKPMVQRQDDLGGGEATQELESSINSARGGGQPLEAGLQRSMGEAMGADFSGVRVHTDAQADQLNRSIQAKAFTTGQDVFFRQGEYNPGSRGGQELIAHELTHVLQQNGVQEKGKSLTLQVEKKNEEKAKGKSEVKSNADHILQRMTSVYDAGDLGYSDRIVGVFANETVYMVKHKREDIPTSVKDAVNAFNDGDGVSSYKHFVPYNNILTHIIDAIEGKMTRSEVVTYLTSKVNAINPFYIFRITTPLDYRAAFEAWFDEAIVAICDCPDNIFRYPSSGDGNGTRLDKPTPTGANTALEQRLNNIHSNLSTQGLTNL